MIRFTEEINQSRYALKEHTISVLQVMLTYEPVRGSGSENGMIFVPAWVIVYQDQKDAQYGFECYALFNAIDGTLIDATFH